MEHRCGFRRTATAQVLVRTPDGISAKAELRNISASGALLRTPLPAPLYALVSVRFPGRIDAHWIEAHVVRQADDGLAIEWTEFSPDVVREVLRSISRDDSVRVAVDVF
jgi:PilZ domain-containing protein